MKQNILLILSFLFFINCYSQTVIEMEKYNGVYKLECIINGIPMNFIFDTGASNVSISSTEALFLIKQGLITDDDIIGNVNFKIANGKTLEGTKINIKKIEIGGLILDNVTATVVHEMDSPLLLGQSVLSRLGKITIDGNKLIIQSSNLNSAISTIEELSTWSETTFGIENTYKTEIDFNPDTGKVIFKNFVTEYNNIYNYEITFYIDDIIKSSMEHKIYQMENSDGLYSIWIDFKAKDKTIEWKTTKHKKGNKYAAFTEKEFKDFMVLMCNNNQLPEKYHEKYLESWKSFLGIDFSTKKKSTNKSVIKIKNIETLKINEFNNIKLGSNINDYNFVIKRNNNNQDKFKYNTTSNNYDFSSGTTHYVDLNKFNKNTFYNKKIIGVFLKTVDDKIFNINIITEHGFDLYNKLLLKLGKPWVYGKGENPDDVTIWKDNDVFVSITADYFSSKNPEIYNINFTDDELEKSYKLKN